MQHHELSLQLHSEATIHLEGISEVDRDLGGALSQSDEEYDGKLLWKLLNNIYQTGAHEHPAFLLLNKTRYNKLGNV